MKKRKHRIYVRARSLTSIAMNMAKLIYYRQCGYSEKNIKRAARYMISQHCYPSLKDVKSATSSWEYEQKVFNDFAHAIISKNEYPPTSGDNPINYKDDPQPSNFIDNSVKLPPLTANVQGRIAEYDQAIIECLQDPTVEGLVAYHRLVAGPDDILDHHDKLFGKDCES